VAPLHAVGLYGFYHFCFDRLALVNFPFLKTQPLTTIPKVLSRLGEFDVMTLRRKRGRGGINWGFGTDIYTLLYLK